MKRTLLFMACVLASLTMSAQENSYFDYVPFVKEGKKWHVVHTEFGTNFHREQYVFRNENVTKTGKTYMTMYRTEDVFMVTYDEEALHKVGFYREEGRKIYNFDDNMQEEHLLFDYSLKEGDSYETYSYEEQKMVTYKVLSVRDYAEGPKVLRYTQEADSMRAEYRYLRIWTVCRADDNTLQKTWIEGVGSIEGPLASLQDEYPISCRDYLAYVEFPDYYRFDNPYLPFSFYDTMNKQIHGCNLPKTAYIPEDWHSQLTYELEDNRLHVYGQLVLNCGCYNYVYFTEELTDNPLVHKLHFEIQNVGEEATCVSLFATDFYVPGFDPNLNYIIVDNQGEEHPVINKTPQMAYRPFVEDGKVWKVGSTLITDSLVKMVDYYYFEGDTIVNGKTCKQMKCQRFVSPDYPGYDIILQYTMQRYVGAWYEEDKKVYAYDSISNQFKLMYDFSVDANDTLQINGQSYVIGPRLTGGMKGFKGVYRDVWEYGESFYQCAPWLEGVGGIYAPPTINVFNVELEDPAWFLMSCTVGDEVIYLNDEYEDAIISDGANASKRRFDFTHTTKLQPKTPRRSEEEQSLYGEYNDKLLGINLDPVDDAYLVRITDETGKVVYEKAIDAGNIVALNVDISAYAKGRYTVTVENSKESFTGEFETQTTGIEEVRSQKSEVRDYIYNLQGQRLTSLQKGLNIVNGKKVYVK